MVMGYRVLTWLVAYVDLVLSVLSLVGLISMAYSLISLSLTTPTFPERLGQVTTFTMAVILLPLVIIGCRRLIQATETSGKPERALKLTNLWWIVSLISYTVSIPMAITETFIKPEFFYLYPETSNDVQFDPKIVVHVVHAIYFSLNAFKLFCVFKFRQELKSTIPHSISYAMTPLEPKLQRNDSKHTKSSTEE